MTFQLLQACYLLVKLNFSNGSWVAGMIKDQAPDAPIGVMAFPAVEGAAWN